LFDRLIFGGDERVQPNGFSYHVCVISLTLLALWQNASCEGGKTGAMSRQQNRVAKGNWGGTFELTQGENGRVRRCH
jgi:hypothetical protein